MKRTAIAIFLLVGILVAIPVNSAIIQTTIDDIIAPIAECRQAILDENPARAAAFYKDAYDRWEKFDTYLSCVINHAIIHNTEEFFVRAGSALPRDETEQSLAEIDLLLYKLRGIQRENKVDIRGIL